MESERRITLYSVALFAAAVIALSVMLGLEGSALREPVQWVTALSFVAFGLFTIQVGFPHPHAGYVSFDRIAQVASLLIFAPVDAAWINGLASLIFPWQRMARGEPFLRVLAVALHNAGLMTLVVLAGGLAYRAAGGPLPLQQLDLATAPSLLVLVMVLQGVNEIGLYPTIRFRGMTYRSQFSGFTTGVEGVSALAGILTAIVVVRLEAGAVVLFLVLMSLAMWTLQSFATIRLDLEDRVRERTHELEDKTRELDRLAREDPLTGLYNRRHIDEHLQREFERARRYGRPLSVALADVDHFKRINDRYSHGVGDQVLVGIAAVLREGCRESDAVARYGGEEFLFCFPETTLAEAINFCERLRETLAAEVGPTIEPGLGITMSFGVAERAHHGSPEALLAAADVCLYRAKSDGRNRVVGGSGVGGDRDGAAVRSARPGGDGQS